MNHITDDPNETRVEVVPCLSLDDYVRERKIERVDFIKCDVERAELHVLHGARHTLTAYKPTILLECNIMWTERFGYTPKEVIASLDDLGYEAVPAKGNAGQPDGALSSGNLLFKPQ
jgi:hypothetical protein